jgi:predicted nucleic acid-binding protein
MIIVDSSVYIDWLRRRVDPREELGGWLRAHEVATCGIIRAEVVRGVREPAQKARVDAMFNIMQEIPTDARMWFEIRELAWRLDREGKTLPLADIVIACCALRSKAEIFTLDKHFWLIPGLQVRSSLA